MRRRLRLSLRTQRGVRRNGGARRLLPDAVDLHQGLQPNLRLRRSNLSQHLRGSFAWCVASPIRRMPDDRSGRRCSRPSRELRSRRRDRVVRHRSLLSIHGGAVLWRSVRSGRVHRTAYGLHQGMGAGLRLRRAQLQQRLRGALAWRFDSAPRSLSGRSSGSGRGRRCELRDCGQRHLCHGPVLPVHPSRKMRRSEQARQVPAPPASLHGRIQPGLRLRRQHLRERMLRAGSRRIDQERERLHGSLI